MKSNNRPDNTNTPGVAPARGAWIEMGHESKLRLNIVSRPHGARGLKSMIPHKPIGDKEVAPARGAWIEI